MGEKRSTGGARMQWRGAAVAAVAVVLGTVRPAAAEAQDAGGPDLPDVGRLIEASRGTYANLRSLRARFEQRIEVPLLGRSRFGEGIWYQKGPGRFKMEFTEPAGDVIVADGTHLWLYYPSTHPDQVIRSRIEADVTGAGLLDLQGRIFDEAEQYDARAEGRDEVRGRPTWLVTFTPIEDSPYRSIRVWIDPASHLVRKFEITEQNETIRTVVLWQLEPDRPVPDSAFAFVPPPGADVFAG